MLAHPTLEQLHALGLPGMVKGFKELENKAEARSLDHAEWLALLLEYELTLRRQKQFETRARVARLRHAASVEDVDYQSPRGLDRALFLKLAACDWIAERRNLLVTGASGLGKSWLACALGHKACRENISVLYARVPRLFADLAIAHGEARYARLLRSLARVKLLILDDWGPEALTPDQARDLLEIVEDRYDRGSLIITSQVPVDRWHDLIGVRSKPGYRRRASGRTTVRTRNPMLFASTGDLLQLYNKPHNMSKRWLDKYLNLLALFRCDRLLPGPPGAPPFLSERLGGGASRGCGGSGSAPERRRWPQTARESTARSRPDRDSPLSASPPAPPGGNG